MNILLQLLHCYLIFLIHILNDLKFNSWPSFSFHQSLEVLLFEKMLQGFFGTQGDTVIEKCKF